MTSAQCRAGRALLGWSQEQLEERSGVSKKAIADFERDAQIPYPRTLREISAALEVSGVQMIPENGGGAGVRLKAAVPRLSRKKVSRFERRAVLSIFYRGRDFQLQLSTDILDDMDRTNHESDAAMERSMDAHMNSILLSAAAAIDAGRADTRGIVILNNEDFEDETGPTRRRPAGTLLRFEVGQKFMNKRPPHKVTEVIQIADDGRKAWVDLRTPDGTLWQSSWVTFAQFIEHWSLMD